MKWRFSSVIKVAAAAFASVLPFMASETQAMPSFARQTGMVCNSCHIGTDNVPNFTRTGRIFAMRGYTRPIVREKLRADGQTVDGEEQYGGDYLSLNWMDFFAGRFISEFASQSKTNGVKSDVTSTPLARFAMFYTGPITDWLGLWTEVGYLGNNNLINVNTQNPSLQSGAATGLNLFAYDEYRLSTSRMINDNSFIGMSLGNEPGDVVTQFVFPLGIPRFMSLGQGGVGKSDNMATLSLHAFLNDQLWLQFAPNTGLTNTSWSNGWNQYYAIAWDAFRKTDNDLWLGFEYMRGNDAPSVMTPVKTSFICTATCPPGVSDAGGLSFSNTLGGRAVAGAPVETVDTWKTWSYRAEWDVADMGPHSWVAMFQGNGVRQDFVSGGSVKRDLAGLYLRYFYKRTYGFYASWAHDFNYKYTDPIGNSHDFGNTNSKNITLLWNPAMNFSVHLSISPNSQNAVYNRDTQSPNTTSSWSLGAEYSF
ncbi:MAG TPA: hypothetical protein VMV45_05895 [Casimicrobiaceae bacterium]|nr:hypothetical protein [Casimicrobiaceae bacterium]